VREVRVGVVFCEEIGADFYSANATGAVTKAKELLPA